MNTFAKNLRKYMDKKGITGEQIAKQMGLSTSTVIHWSNGRRFPKKEEYIKKLSEILGVTEQDLFDSSKKSEIVKTELLSNRDKYLPFLPKNLLPSYVKEVSLINGYVGAGSYAVESEVEVVDKIYIDIHTIAKRYREKEIQAIKVIGDSMTPYVNDGDIVLFYKFKDGEKPDGDGKYIIETSLGEQVKNLKFMLNGNIRIISENPSYHTKDGYDEEITKDSQEYFKILGKVIGRIMKG